MSVESSPSVTRINQQKMELDQFILDRVNTALNFAKQAVDSDTKGDTTNAILYYKEAIKILESEVIQAPEENQQRMFDLAKQYSERVDVLEHMNPPSSPRVSSLHHSGFIYSLNDFKEEPAQGALPDPPPTVPMFRSFWLMRILSKTITSGGYLTPTIWVPKAVWYQQGSKYTSLTTKIVSCETINEWLLKLADFNVDELESVSKELDSFCTQLSHIQNSLSKTLSFIEEYKEETGKKEKGMLSSAIKIKKVGEKMAKSVVGMRGSRSHKADDVSTYVQLLQEMFDNSQFMGKWLEHFLACKPSSTITFRLKRASDFFYSVICNFVVRDLNSQIERYMKRSKRKFREKSTKIRYKWREDGRREQSCYILDVEMYCLMWLVLPSII